MNKKKTCLFCKQIIVQDLEKEMCTEKNLIITLF